MTREKVIAGLECLTHVDFAVYKSECEIRGCPYKDTDCEIAVMEDALALLKAQEPRVMKMTEEVFALRFDDVVYVELQPTRAILSAIVYDSIPWIHGELGVLQIRCIQEPLANMDFAWYGKTWRCWTSRPTDEQQKAVKWDA